MLECATKRRAVENSWKVYLVSRVRVQTMPESILLHHINAIENEATFHATAHIRMYQVLQFAKIAANKPNKIFES